MTSQGEWGVEGSITATESIRKLKPDAVEWEGVRGKATEGAGEGKGALSKGQQLLPHCT